MFRFWKKKDYSKKWLDAVKTSSPIVADFGEFLEGTPISNEIFDVAVLPHDKEKILSSLMLMLLVSDTLREEMKVSAITLAQFQKGVGKHPLHQLGFDSLKFDATKMSGDNLVNLMLVNPAGVEAYNKLQPFVLADRRRIGAMIEAAEASFQKTQSQLSR